MQAGPPLEKLWKGGANLHRLPGFPNPCTSLSSSSACAPRKLSCKPGSHSQPPPSSRGDWLSPHFLENLPRPPRLSQQPSPHFRFSKHLEVLLSSLCNFPSLGWLSTARSPGRLLCARYYHAGLNPAGIGRDSQARSEPRVTPARQAGLQSLSFPSQTIHWDST